MKKSLILGFVGLSLSVFVAGCISVDTKDISFQEAYNTFVQGVSGSDLVQYVHYVDFPNFEEKMNLEISSDNSTFDLSANFDSKSKANKATKNFLSDIDLDFNLKDKVKNTEVSGSGGLTLSMIDKEIFMKLKNIDINLGEGNAEGGLISMMLDNVKNKWIQLDYAENYSGITTMTDTLSQNISNNNFQLLLDYPIFYNAGKTIYEEKDAYKLGINYDNLNLILAKITSGDIVTINSGDINLDVLLLIEDTDTVDLIVNSISVEGQSFNASGYVAEDGISLSIDNVDTSSKFNISILKRRTNIVINFDIISTYETSVLRGEFKISPDIDEDGIELDIDGDLYIQIEENNTADIQIQGEYQIKPLDSFDVTKPESYMLLSQLFGDPYGLSANISTGDLDTMNIQGE